MLVLRHKIRMSGLIKIRKCTREYMKILRTNQINPKSELFHRTILVDGFEAASYGKTQFLVWKSTLRTVKETLARNVQKGFDTDTFHTSLRSWLIGLYIYMSRVEPSHLPGLSVGLVLITLDLRSMTLKLSGFFSDYKVNTGNSSNVIQWYGHALMWLQHTR